MGEDSEISGKGMPVSEIASNGTRSSLMFIPCILDVVEMTNNMH
jgi:hypothetical protein